MLSSRSVAVSVRRLPLASHSRCERIGMVVFRSTTPCVRFSSRSRSNFFTLNSIQDFLRRSAASQNFKPATVPCFIEGIKTVVVAVAVETRISSQRAPLYRDSLWTMRGIARSPVEIAAPALGRRPKACTGAGKRAQAFAQVFLAQWKRVERGACEQAHRIGTRGRAQRRTSATAKVRGALVQLVS